MACGFHKEQIVNYPPSAPQLVWHETSPLASPVVRKQEATTSSPTKFLRYFKALIGQNCSMAKWTELTIKAMRRSAVQTDVPTIESATSSIDIADIKRGDLLFFHSVKGVPSYAIISKSHRSKGLEGITVTRGKIRYIRIDPARPHTRRRNGRIINSFLRIAAANDRTGGYLAGELIREVRRPAFLL